MGASAAATRSRSFARASSSKAALYCGSHSGNLKSSLVIVLQLVSGEATLAGKLEQESLMVGLYPVAQEPSPKEGGAEVCGETQAVCTWDGGPLDFLTFEQCMAKREQTLNEAMKGHGESAQDARG